MTYIAGWLRGLLGFGDPILSDIKRDVAEASVVIAEITSMNVNVTPQAVFLTFVGYAEQTGLPVP